MGPYMWDSTHFEIVLRKYDNKGTVLSWVWDLIWFDLQDWQVWKCWAMEAVLFLWSHSTFSAVFPLRIYTGIRHKVAPTICTMNCTVGDCYGHYRQLNCFTFLFVIYFFLSLLLYEYVCVRVNVCVRVCVCTCMHVCDACVHVHACVWCVCVLHACVCVCVHNGVGFHFWGIGAYELDFNIPSGSIVLNPSYVPEKASVNRKDVNKKWHSYNKWNG